MITCINESKTLTKQFHVNVNVDLMEKSNSNQWWNNDKCWCKRKEIHVWEKDYVWNLATYICQNRKYLTSNMDDSAITWVEVIKSFHEEIKTITINLNEKM